MIFHCIKMEFQKIVNLLETISDDKDLPRFATKKWMEVYDQSARDYRVNKEIRIKTPMLRSNLCDFSDAYIVVEGTVTVAKKHLSLITLRVLLKIKDLHLLLLLILQMMQHLIENWFLKTMHRLLTASQK